MYWTPSFAGRGEKHNARHPTFVATGTLTSGCLITGLVIQRVGVFRLGAMSDQTIVLSLSPLTSFAITRHSISYSTYNVTDAGGRHQQLRS
jgi:hypothetical protein